MTTHSDQIEEIKKAEEKAKKHLEQTVEKIQRDENELSLKLSAEVENRKKELMERRKQKLEIVEGEAGHIKTSKRSESEGQKTQIISSAQSKQSGAVDLIITKFVEHIKA